MGQALAGADYTFTLSIPGIPTISIDGQTNADGKASFKTTIPKGATLGQGSATVLITSTEFGSTQDYTDASKVIAEATARHLPLLMAWSRTQHEHYAHGLVLPERVAWLTFPVVQEAFRATIDELLPADLDSVHLVRLGGAGAQIEGAVRVRALSLLAREYDA